MFCSKCGNKIEKNVGFCPNCGTPTNANASVEVQPVVSQPMPPYGQQY